jgi:hypothetical protein
MKTETLKDYYYNVIHWQITMYIHQIRNKNYPIEYWNESLKESLTKRNEYIFRIRDNKEIKQLTLF